MIGWLLDRIPSRTRREWEAAYKLGLELGAARGYMTGYRAGVAHSRKLVEIRDGEHANGVTVAWPGGPVVWPGGPSVSVSGGSLVSGFAQPKETRPGLRLLDGGEAS